MRITKHNNIDLHWWGQDLLLVRDVNEHYVLDEVEAFFLEHVCKINDVEQLVDAISQETGSDSETIMNFIEVFMKNFDEYFFYSNGDSVDPITISGKKMAYYPLELHVSLTSRCFLKCKHCYKSASGTGIDICYDDLRAFLNRMCGFVPYLCISGGEPTLHSSFSAILNEYSSKYSICVLTSGVYTTNLLGTLSQADRGIVVSMYSSTPEIHDAFTGQKGSYSESLNTINKALAMGIPVGVTTVLFEENSDRIQSFIDFFVDNGVDRITIGKISKVGRAKDNDVPIIATQSLSSQINGADRQKKVSVLIDEKHSSNDLPHSVFKCYAGALTWSINEYGQIQPCGICSVDDLALGNISQFDSTILYNRSQYIDKVKQLSLIKQMYAKGNSCPFND